MIPKGKKLISQAREIAVVTAIPGTQIAERSATRWSLTVSIHRSDSLLLSPGQSSAAGVGIAMRTDGTNVLTFSYPIHGDIVRQPWFARQVTANNTIVVIETSLVDE